ncbi:MAG: hypothetical protein EBT79_07705 [Actinobacteria bacterium]|nr:hypothetical protein [Actinomycetota bacterium]
MYADVEELLYPGYLTQTVVAGGVTVSFRSAYPSDQHILRVRIPACQTVRDWKRVAVANAAWEVDGHIVEADDLSSRRRLEDLFGSLSAPVMDTMYAAVSTVRGRLNDAVGVFEAYCYEPQSRTKWRMHGRRCPSERAPSWVSKAGSNSLQQLWVSFNLYEDDRLQWENDWYAATTVASTMAAKWVQQIRTEEANRAKAETERRNEVIRRAKNPGVDRDESDTGIKVVRHRTNDDLIEQMRRWQRGELDDHDRIVQGYKDGIRRRHDETREAHERRMAALDEALAQSPDVAPVVGYTAEQMAEMGLKAPTRTRRLYDAGHPGRLYDKYLSADIPIGGLRPDGKGGDMTVNRPPISEAVSGRRVTVPDEGGR